MEKIVQKQIALTNQQISLLATIKKENDQLKQFIAMNEQQHEIACRLIFDFNKIDEKKVVSIVSIDDNGMIVNVKEEVAE